jgi:hypothetical protein
MQMPNSKEMSDCATVIIDCEFTVLYYELRPTKQQNMYHAYWMKHVLSHKVQQNSEVDLREGLCEFGNQATGHM